MKSIVSKKDIDIFLNQFKEITDFDEEGRKHYLVFQDIQRNGDWTLMHYEAEGKWTLHGKGPGYCDPEETELSKEELTGFVYKNRKYINREIKAKKQVLV
ncbi:hypothetical protein V1498_13910 [Peribacillus sp. SCS-26]|uniref:hypothetical protein n=1 Tax=Paraperibacillus marinus TaxID=3115295 RepID=UPI0039066CED